MDSCKVTDSCQNNLEEDKERVENEEESISLSVLIQLIVNTIISEEKLDIELKMLKYRNNLSDKILAMGEEEHKRKPNLKALFESFRAGWDIWKKDGEDKEEASFNAFHSSMCKEQY